MIAKVDTSEAFAPVYKLQHDLMIVGGLALLVVLLTGAWLSRSLLGPLRELTAGATVLPRAIRKRTCRCERG